MSAAQQKYSTFDRELLAAYLAVLHFRQMIESRNVTLFTDHKPLVSAFYSKNVAKSYRQQRHLATIVEYVTDMQYIRGAENIVADCLSRTVNAVQVDSFDLSTIALEQLQDEDIKNYLPRLKSFAIDDERKLWCDVSTSYPRPFIPSVCRLSVFRGLHNISHPGVRPSLRLIKSRYFWPAMDKDIRIWTRQCTACQSSKIQRHVKSEVQHFPIPSNRFEIVHIDIVGPLPPCTISGESYPSNQRYILTCIDRATRWIEAIPLTEITAASVAHAFLTTWVSRFGVPLYVVTDRGRQFESELFKELSSLIGFHRLRTTSYHPQSNGIIERCHRTLKTAIMARKQDWLTALPVVLLGIRCIPNDSGLSPFTLITGGLLMSPRSIIDSQKHNVERNSTFVAELARKMSEIDFTYLSSGIHHSAPTSYFPAALKSCSHVWLRVDRIRRPLEAPYVGPLLVKARYDKFFKVAYPSGIEETVSVDRLKPVFLPQPASLNKAKNKDENKAENQHVSPSTEQEKEIKTTRSGRRVRFKKREDIIYY